MARERRITVEGETFLIRRRGKGDYSYDWISGPNPGYGFASSSYPAVDLDDDAHEEAVREFLAEIDPETGYLAEP